MDKEQMWDEIERLNELLRKWQNHAIESETERVQLKDEIDHLKSELQMEKENEDRLVREWQKANNEVYGLQRQVAALIDNQTRLEAEVERLTKAGDAMADEMLKFNHPHASVYLWCKAKEGGQP